MWWKRSHTVQSLFRTFWEVFWGILLIKRKSLPSESCWKSLLAATLCSWKGEGLCQEEFWRGQGRGHGTVLMKQYSSFPASNRQSWFFQQQWGCGSAVYSQFPLSSSSKCLSCLLFSCSHYNTFLFGLDSVFWFSDLLGHLVLLQVILIHKELSYRQWGLKSNFLASLLVFMNNYSCE